MSDDKEEFIAFGACWMEARTHAPMQSGGEPYLRFSTLLRSSEPLNVSDQDSPLDGEPLVAPVGEAPLSRACRRLAREYGARREFRTLAEHTESRGVTVSRWALTAVDTERAGARCGADTTSRLGSSDSLRERQFHTINSSCRFRCGPPDPSPCEAMDPRSEARCRCWTG